MGSGALGETLSWKRQHIEDPVACVVWKARVKSTVMSVLDEDEVGEKPWGQQAVSSDTFDWPQEGSQVTPNQKRLFQTPSAESAISALAPAPSLVPFPLL